MAPNEETLRAYGLKVTPGRLAVLEALKKFEHYASAQELHGKLKKMDLVTIYRTLTSFEKAGLIKRIDLGKDSVCYELAGGHHHHIICTSCEKVSEFENVEDEKLIQAVLKEAKDFSSVTHHSFDLFGICNSCAKTTV